LEFNDMLELSFRMLRSSCVPVRVVAAGMLTMAKASGREGDFVDSPLLRSLARGNTDSLMLGALRAELEGRKLRPDEVPGRVGDEGSIALFDVLWRDDVEGVLLCVSSRRRGLDPRTVLESRFDFVPLLSSGLNWRVLAVELNARGCAL
jgi:hypothetical protein